VGAQVSGNAAEDLAAVMDRRFDDQRDVGTLGHGKALI
jgi:hypothetical protein